MPPGDSSIAPNWLIEASGIDLAYDGGDPAVRDLSLQLGAGELVIVLGPNGGGKTTLFKALASELAVRSGTLAINAPVAYLPQHDGSRLDFPVTTLDVVMMGTLSSRPFWRRASRRDREAALDALEVVGLADRAGDSYGELSGGQRRRVLLARTIVKPAPILLLDEPLAGIDPASARSIRRSLRELRDRGRLVIVSAHSIEHAREADRVLCLNGRLIADGDPATVLTDRALRETYADDIAIVTNAQGSTMLAVTDRNCT